MLLRSQISQNISQDVTNQMVKYWLSTIPVVNARWHQHLCGFDLVKNLYFVSCYIISSAGEEGVISKALSIK